MLLLLLLLLVVQVFYCIVSDCHRTVRASHTHNVVSLCTAVRPNDRPPSRRAVLDDRCLLKYASPANESSRSQQRAAAAADTGCGGDGGRWIQNNASPLLIVS